MSRYLVEHQPLGPHRVVELRDAVSGARVRIARRGAAVLGFLVPHAGGMQELADGYRDAAELDALKSARFAVMAPFANRIADARYCFDDETFDLQPGVEHERGIRHGFVRDVEFDVDDERTDDHGAEITLGYRGLRPGVHSGWPFAVDLQVTYRLHAGGLDVAVTQRNVGERAAPCFCGWHPYFRVGDDAIDNWELTVPARYRVRTDAALIPLPGDDALVSLDDQPELDFRQPRVIGETVIDGAFAGLQADADGRIRTRLRHPRSGLEVCVWQHDGVMLVFTGDGLPQRPRASVALEPMQAMTNAFNRDDCREQVVLAPGASRRFSFGVEVPTA